MKEQIPHLEPTAEGFRVRIRYGSGKQAKLVIPMKDRAAAEKRTLALRELAKSIRALPPAEAKLFITRAAEAATEAKFRAIVRLAQEEQDAPVKQRSAVTFAELADEWTSGRLHKKFPDHVPEKRTAELDGQRFDLLNKHVGKIPIADFTLEDADFAMSKLSENLSPTTRRHYAGILARLLKLAVYPCRLREASPLPSGWLPRIQTNKAKAWLYPSEDKQLMRCKEVPLDRRMLWGFLAREGMRLNEAMGLRWSDIDLERGSVRLDANKTDDPRAWALRPDVSRALRAFKNDVAQEDSLVFAPFSDAHVADQLRAHLKKALVTRAELFEKSDRRMPIRAHDLRGTFVTLALANGKTETWVADRTGHKSSAMINRYRRAARHAQELDLGDLSPLDEAIPGLTHQAQGESKVSPKSVEAKIDGVPSGIRTRVVALKGRCPGPG